MTDERFKELVNLYLDREISKPDLLLLRDEIAKNEARRKEFESLRSFYRATQAALQSSDSSDRTLAGDVSADSVIGIRALLYPTMYATGLAACFAVVFVVFGQRFVSNHIAVYPPEENFLAVSIPTISGTEMNGTKLVRVMERRRRIEPRKATLAAQLRLLGMNPDILPVERELANVDLEEQKIRRRVIIPTHTERIEQLVELSPIPETPIIRYQESPNYGTTASSSWPAGFKTSLASFK
ncbi:MAG: hypothetical protein AAGH40_07965 [Verrucomicrobiota bacterium]